MFIYLFDSGHIAGKWNMLVKYLFFFFLGEIVDYWKGFRIVCAGK